MRGNKAKSQSVTHSHWPTTQKNVATLTWQKRTEYNNECKRIGGSRDKLDEADKEEVHSHDNHALLIATNTHTHTHTPTHKHTHNHNRKGAWKLDKISTHAVVLRWEYSHWRFEVRKMIAVLRVGHGFHRGFCFLTTFGPGYSTMAVYLYL